MARLFVPAGFDAAAVSPDLYLFLQNEPDDPFVLLEFHSLGRDRRQVDVAVLGPYGVDVVEVKAKVRGAVIASDNGPWHIRRDDGGIEALPLNGAAGENPYDQAARTAEDFRRWLDGLGVRTQVFPLVLVPHYRRDTSLRNRGFVWATNGLSGFRSSLRSLRPYKDVPVSLSVDDYRRIVEALELTELTGTADAPAPELPSPPRRVLVSAEAPNPVASPPLPISAAAEPPPVLTQPPRGGAAAPPFGGFSGQRSLRLFVPGVVALLLIGVVWFATASREAASPELTAAVGLSVVPSGSDCPDSHLVKGNVNDEGERIFHVEGQRYYEATNPEECFASAEEAEAGGFRASLR